MAGDGRQGSVVIHFHVGPATGAQEGIFPSKSITHVKEQ